MTALSGAAGAAPAPAAPGRRARRRLGRAHSGLTLFGTLLTLGLVGIAVGGAVAVYQTTQQRTSINQAAQLLGELRSGITNIFAGEAVYGAASADLRATLLARDGVPAYALGATAGTIQHPFGGAVNAAVHATNRGTFVITFNDLADAECAGVLDASAGQTQGRSGLVGVAVGSESATAPITAADITTICDDGADNDVAWTFE